MLVFEGFQEKLDIHLARLLTIAVPQKLNFLAQFQSLINTVEHSEELLFADARALHPIGLHG